MWTSADLERYRDRIVKPVSKYGNKKTVVDNITFDSIKESERYRELLHWKEIGAISNLELQKKFELNAGGTHSLIYIADFTYIVNVIKEYVVEDVKGALTTVYKKKRKLMLKVYGIKIREC